MTSEWIIPTNWLKSIFVESFKFYTAQKAYSFVLFFEETPF